jgi:hypothetical protein
MAKDFLKQNSELLKRAFDICSKSPPLNDIHELRKQIMTAVTMIPSIGKIRDEAEKNYRQIKQNVAEECPSQLKSDARKNWIDGAASEGSYQRDRCETIYEGLVLYVSACKAILMNNNIEMSNLRHEPD